MESGDPTIDSIYYVTGDMPLEVQFCNFSIGDINANEWDFENDGIVDSHEKHPVFTYSDTGWYSVNLTVYDGLDTNSFTKENYIYVYQITDINENYCNENNDIQCFPNPFTNKLIIRIESKSENEKPVKIFNISGKLVKEISSSHSQLSWDGRNENGTRCLPGIYFVSYNNLCQKVILK